MKYLTEMDRNELARHLVTIKEISQMDDNNAILRLEEFIYMYCIVSSNENDATSPDVTDNSKTEWLKKYIKECQSLLTKRNIDVQTANGIRLWIDTWFESSYRRDTNKYGEIFSNLLKEVHSVADKIEIEAYTIFVNEFNTTKFVSITSVNVALKHLAGAETCLKQHNIMTDKIYRRIISSKEECAWYRAKKKIADAEVARSGMNEKKYLKLMDEATAMLNQDWCRIFINTPVPNISSII